MSFSLFLPCAAGVETFLADEVHGLTGLLGEDLLVSRGGVRVRGDWSLVLQLNLMSRLAQRVLVQLVQAPYRDERDLYHLAVQVPWEQWFSHQQSFRIDITSNGSALRSLNFAALRVKDAVADRFREQTHGLRPSVDTRSPDVRVQVHLSADQAYIYLDTSGEPLFKRGWRQNKGDAPLKETLAAAMLAACGWWQPARRKVSDVPLYDPCCGSGTIVIEAAQLALGLPAGGQREFGFARLKPFDAAQWQRVRQVAISQGGSAFQARVDSPQPVRVFGSDVAHRMVDFAQRNAERAGITQAVQLRGGDALQRMPPTSEPGILLMNPPYGERIATAGVAGSRTRGREKFHTDAPQSRHSRANAEADGVDTCDEFFLRLAAHWKSYFGGWTTWLLTPDTKLPGRLQLKATRRVPLWNGPIECRLLRFDLTARNADIDSCDGCA